MSTNFLQNFQEFVKEKNLFTHDSHLLVAVSGGVDSVVLCHLLSKSGYSFAMAHCNFNLRGKESEEDAAFVVRLAGQLGKEVHVKKFREEEVTQMPGHSTQMAARELRYQWFAELLRDHNYDLLATAHHLDDQAETMLLNLTKGTGIRGLHGILPLHPPLVRPLLFASKDDILQYAEKKNLASRHDASNDELKYQRNLIRLQVLPVLRQINPSLGQGLDETASRLQFAEHVFHTALHHLQDELFQPHEDGYTISLEALQLLPHCQHFLFEWLHPFGFTAGMAAEAVELITSQPGRKITSATHQLIRDREYLFLRPLPANGAELAEVQITKEMENVRFGNRDFEISVVAASAIADLKNPEVAYLDLEKLQFPLVMRQWQPGDAFQPFGMNAHKKLSDYLTNEKVSVVEKQEIPVITSSGKIAWVAGLRVDQSFALASSSKQALKIKLTR
ncbi:MAG: tRNA lysidine(34) synthetase TilS [Bacteroidia bacterium]